MGYIKPMMGCKFGQLTAIGYCGQDKWGYALWIFRCDCGRKVIRRGDQVRSGHTKSCQCMRANAKRQHGDSRKTSDFNRLYMVWHSMIERCQRSTNRQYADYGGRGIVVCSEWLNYPAFKIWALRNGYAFGLEIDRINNDGNYDPDNCRFVTKAINNRNKRTTVLITVNGVTLCAADWIKRLGCNRGTFEYWLAHFDSDKIAEKIRERIEIQP